MIGLTSTRARTAIAILVTALAAASAADLPGWRTPDGRLYFGAAPPPGSVQIEAVHPTPTRTPVPTLAPARTQRTAEPAPSIVPPKPTMTLRPLPTAEPSPASRPVASPEPVATPEPRPSPQSERSGPGAPAAWQHKAACGEVVTIRNARPTIDLERDRFIMSGEVLVGKGGPVKDVRVCLGGSCVLVADSNVLRDGDTARFTLTVSGKRPEGLTVDCSLPRPR